jgi:hypothetical protein
MVRREVQDDSWAFEMQLWLSEKFCSSAKKVGGNQMPTSAVPIPRARLAGAVH